MIRGVLRKTPLYEGYIVCRASGLRRWGWFRSLHERRPVDASGRPLPWYTYPCIHFLDPRLRRTFRVFEFGCGHSTLWWAARVQNVWAVEHDRKWYEMMRSRVPGNVSLACRPLRDWSYVNEIRGTGQDFDLVVIDGRLRNWCADAAADCLTSSGVIIWDNTDRAQYRRGLRRLANRGFKRLDFVGLAPGLDLETVTTVLYRTTNCLGI